MSARPVASASTDLLFLQQTGLFRSLDEPHLRMLLASGETMSCGPGHMVVEQGTQGGDLFVVKSGVLEARKESGGTSHLVGYIFPGECVGEMSILTGSPRSVTVRVPERADLFRVPGVVFERLLRQDVEIAIGVARGLALRLERANSQSPDEGLEAPTAAAAAPRHLSGDLQYFDVPEVCQTLIQSRRTGVMTVSTTAVSGDVALYFDEGAIKYARVGALTGADAVLYVLRTRLSGRFEFRASDEPVVIPNEKPMGASSMGLLLEAAQQRDEIEALERKLPGPQHAFDVIAASFPFEGPLAAPIDPDEAEAGDALRGDWQPTTEAERDYARTVWAALISGQRLGRILGDRLGREPLTLRIVHTLVVRGAVR